MNRCFQGVVACGAGVALLLAAPAAAQETKNAEACPLQAYVAADSGTVRALNVRVPAGYARMPLSPDLPDLVVWMGADSSALILDPLEENEAATFHLAGAAAEDQGSCTLALPHRPATVRLGRATGASPVYTAELDILLADGARVWAYIASRSETERARLLKVLADAPPRH